MVINTIFERMENPVVFNNDTDPISVTIPDETITIEELFTRAAKGESLGPGGDFDDTDDLDFPEDPSLDDVLGNPDMQDPLLQRSIIENEIHYVNESASRISKKRKSRNKAGREETPVVPPTGNELESKSFEEEPSTE